MIGHKEWFISGSYVNKQVKHPKDIDVYFYSEDAYKKAEKSINLHMNTHRYTDPIYMYMYIAEISPHAVTYYHGGLNFHVQLITRYFGTPDIIFKTMDLNVCKQAILSNGAYVKAENVALPITIGNISSSSFYRFWKYHQEYYKTTPVTLIKEAKKVIDCYIQDTTLIENYYGDENKYIATNKALYNAFSSHLQKPGKHNKPILDYLYAQVDEYSPELLL